VHQGPSDVPDTTDAKGPSPPMADLVKRDFARMQDETPTLPDCVVAKQSIPSRQAGERTLKQARSTVADSSCASKYPLYAVNACC